MAVCGRLLGCVAAGTLFVLRADPDITLLDFVLWVMMYAYAGLGGVFLCCMLTRRGNRWSLVAGLLVGIEMMVLARFSDGRVFTLGASPIAFPWQFAGSTVVAFLVALAGRPQPMDSQIPPATSTTATAR
jgi:SSS family solute:Na+ symporter